VIRVVIADDQPLARAGIVLLLRRAQDITVVAEAADGQEALTQIRTHRPDVVLMDVRMPGTDGVTATRAVVDEGLTSQNSQAIGVIILTTYNLDEAVYASLCAGASGFLLKDAAPTEIVDAIRAVAAGEAWLDPGVTRGLIERVITPQPPTPTPTAEMAALTPREREVTCLLAQGLTDAEIAAQLSISVATVKTHIAHAMTKIGAHSRAQLIIAAYQTALVQTGPQQIRYAAGLSD
jgi:DNA-binding NarL/FixJ family response regulator